MTPKGQHTRDSILVAAEALFAARGFHGTSTRDVAAATEIPLASLVYHFARKEQLYAAVLDAIAGDLLAAIDGCDVDGLVEVLVAWTEHSPARVALLLRELLDNPHRVARAQRLPLAPFLARAASIVADAGVTEPELAVLHIVGGLGYVAIAWPTVTRILGSARSKQLTRHHHTHAVAFADRVLAKDSSREPIAPAHPRPPRPRPPRPRHDRLRSDADDHPGR